jgi:hypothetical protein
MATKESQNQELIKLVTSRQNKLESQKEPWIQRMQDVADYVIPQRDDLRDTLESGLEKGTKIYDGTAQGAAVLATNGIHGYHVSPAFNWFRYVMNRRGLNEIKEIRMWLEDVEFGMYQALQRSNFYSEIWQYIYDGFTIATAAMYVEEDITDGRIIFEAIHPGEGYISENRFGEVDIYHRKRKVSARKLVQQFGEENLPESVKLIAKESPFSEIKTINAVFPREEFDSRMKDARNKRYASVWIICDGNHIARVSGFDEFPYAVWRYMKTGKDAYGVSPAHLVMADIKGVNLMSKTIQGAAQLSVDPAYNIPSYLQGRVQLKPRGFNYIEKQGDQITPVNTGINYPIGIDREQAKQQSIRDRFHVDTFLLLTQLNKEPGSRTAFEVENMLAERAAVLGAELGPLNSQLDNMLERVYTIEQRAGRIPQPPDMLMEMSQEDPSLRFDPVYTGPLAQAQRERFSKDPIRKTFVDLEPIFNIKPETMDLFNFDETAIKIADVNNLPEDLKNDKTQVAAIRAGRAQAQAQELAEEDAMAATKNIETMSKADKNLGGQISAAVTSAQENQV